MRIGLSANRLVTLLADIMSWHIANHWHQLDLVVSGSSRWWPKQSQLAYFCIWTSYLMSRSILPV